MKTTPLLTLLALAMIALTATGLELHWLLARRGHLLALEQTQHARQRENDRRRKDIADLEANKASILASIQKIHNGISSTAPVAGSFQPLYTVGVPVELQPGTPESWEYRFGPSELEFHRLLPALRALENEYPLIRIHHLELVSSAQPFAPSASTISMRGSFSIVKGLPLENPRP